MKKTRLPVLLPVLLLSITGCAVGPNYHRPPQNLPEKYEAMPEGWKLAEPQPVPQGSWWAVFADPLLDRLLVEMDESNQALLAATSVARQAQIEATIANWGLIPTVAADGSATKAKNPGSRTETTYSVGGRVSWEVDLWGRLRRTAEAAKAQAQASEADLAAARLSLQATVAQTYFQWRTSKDLIRLYERTLSYYEKSLELVSNQYQAGIVSRSEVTQAESQLRSTQVQARELQIELRQAENALAVLTGKVAGTIKLAPTDDDFRPPQVMLPVAVPSALLERRPDVAAAEQKMIAANAAIGVATAAYFPTLSLNGSGGFRNSVLSKLLTLPFRFWSIGPSLAVDLFDPTRGLKRDVAVAAWEESVARYRQTVLTALQEVEDQLVALHGLDEEITLQQQALQSAREAAVIARNQYREGIIPLLSVIVIEATALNNERNLVSLINRRASALALLIKALGGGFDTNNPAA